MRERERGGSSPRGSVCGLSEALISSMLVLTLTSLLGDLYKQDDLD